jgi:hypothetical protein
MDTSEGRKGEDSFQESVELSSHLKDRATLRHKIMEHQNPVAAAMHRFAMSEQWTVDTGFPDGH